MDKNFVDFEVPTDRLNKTLENSISRGERHMRHRRAVKTFTVCALVVGLSLVNVARPALAERIPLIGGVVKQLNTSLGLNKDSKDFDKYSQTIDKSATYKGIEIKASEAILDDQKNLVVFYEITNEKGFSSEDKKYFKESNPLILMDGLKRVSFQPNYNTDADEVKKVLPKLLKDGEMLDLREVTGAVKGMFTDDSKTFRGIAQYCLTSFDKIPDSFKVKLDIEQLQFSYDAVSDVRYLAPQNIEGKWNLEFEVKKMPIKEVKTVKPNIKSEHVSIKDITITPFTTDVSVDIDFNKISKVKLIDDKNNEYTNYNTINKKDHNGYYEITFRFYNINKDVQNLKLVFLNNEDKEVYQTSITTK